MKVTVDKIEEGFLEVVLPDGECVNISRKLCPEAKEGDVIVIDVSSKDTNDSKNRIEEKLNILKRRQFDK